MSAININLVAPMNQLGYGVVGCNIFKALNEIGHNVALWPIGGEVRWPGDEKFKALVQKGVLNARFYDQNAPSLRIWHQFELDMFPGRGKRVAWPIFELNRFDDREKHHLSSVDEIIVCSEWARQVIIDNDIDVPVTVAPLGVDPSLFYFDEAEKSKRPAWLRDTTVFINVGKWEKRKGHEELLAAFNAAFSPGDDVELWMINENPFIGHENTVWKKKYVNSKMGANIKFFPRFEGHYQMRKIFSHVDCGVFPSHAEGWNLEIPELMACGAHIIATDYSGHTQFLTDENSFKLDVTGMESASDGKWFHGQGEWCQFDMDQLVQHMRDVHDRKQAGELGPNMEGVKMARSLSWEQTAYKVVDAMLPEPVACP